MQYNLRNCGVISLKWYVMVMSYIQQILFTLIIEPMKNNITMLYKNTDTSVSIFSHKKYIVASRSHLDEHLCKCLTQLQLDKM